MLFSADNSKSPVDDTEEENDKGSQPAGFLAKSAPVGTAALGCPASEA
jgi:hypothetical protein